MTDKMYDIYLKTLHEELVPAMGCTEPIAIAYAAALARKALGCIPASVKIKASANIIKNVKSVVVPNTGGKKGIAAKGVENTIHNVGRVARYGMAETDREIIRIMTDEN
ncbi:MAG: hypothetical protein LUH08_05045 [Ruminococcus sp.]|nr:hypothetical protein [Ruminococcus sp.]